MKEFSGLVNLNTKKGLNLNSRSLKPDFIFDDIAEVRKVVWSLKSMGEDHVGCFCHMKVIPSLIKNFAGHKIVPTRTSCIELCDFGKLFYLCICLCILSLDLSIKSRGMDWIVFQDAAGSDTVSGFCWCCFSCSLTMKLIFWVLICKRVLKPKGKR